jgi:hypothetical protein
MIEIMSQGIDIYHNFSLHVATEKKCEGYTLGRRKGQLECNQLERKKEGNSAEIHIFTNPYFCDQ